MGGLGNQLFQIATAYAYSKEHNKQLIVDASWWSAGQGVYPLEYKNSIFKNFEFGTNFGETCARIEEIGPIIYEELPGYSGHVSLNGYFQSPKYFKKYFEEFKNELWFPNVDTSFILEKNVAFHIRRGDYIQFPHIYGVCGVEYFNKMFDIFSDYQVNVFTDSPNPVLEEFKHRTFNLIQTSSELNDFTLMSLHENMVCSNSSFSWWASQLGKMKEKIMVPNKWLLTYNSDDIYVNNMTLVEV